MFERLRAHERAQLALGLLMGIVFGFLLQKGGVTRYDVIIGQLLLADFTVLQLMLSAVVTGMIGIYLMKRFGLVALHTRRGSVGSTIIGGLIFGAGFGILGYCPGTVAGAVGQGSLDALVGGVPGILIGTGAFAALYPLLDRHILNRGKFPGDTIPEILGVNPWVVILPAAAGIVALLWLLHWMGF
ncbi:MAG: YeeE/YedE family protein [Methanomicrobiaceae archaeon]|uniref:Uncharacterized protein n=1 Tax=hydrocarbon metagenome TaxID=938273 RepID=A0A0W8FJT1_9ZZZZ|nr:YeeE/YedE family protein [Methanomicrobiaceae archaeon]MDD5420132.1 YeeE/YedE thiosulfate transporter family protein [Methanomicrobiaceae archaeon]